MPLDQEDGEGYYCVKIIKLALRLIIIKSRPVSVTADNKEFRNIKNVEVNFHQKNIIVNYYLIIIILWKKEYLKEQFYS